MTTCACVYGKPAKRITKCELPQRVHVGIWYVLGAQRGSHIPTLKPKYIPYSYMGPLGLISPCLALYDNRKIAPKETTVQGAMSTVGSMCF